MSAATIAVPTATPPATGGVVFGGIDWPTYRNILAAFGERRFRHTYDRGRLEIMAPSFFHEGAGSVFRLLVLVLAQETGQKMKAAKSTTLTREDVDRGLEPDECFYIQHYAAIRGRREIDLPADPPPDLAIEVDHTRSSVPRLPVYAALGVPEVWRFRGDTLEVHVLGGDGAYHRADRSPTFPTVDPAGLPAFVTLADDLDDLELMDRFRQWVRGLPRPAAG